MGEECGESIRVFDHGGDTGLGVQVDEIAFRGGGMNCCLSQCATEFYPCVGDTVPDLHIVIWLYPIFIDILPYPDIWLSADIQRRMTL